MNHPAERDVYSFGGDALETRSESEFANIKRAADQAALLKGAQTPDATAPGGATKDHASLKDPKGVNKASTSKAGAKAGAMPTIEAVWAPLPTTCKKGEAPVAKNAKQRLFVKGRKHASASRHRAHEGASGTGSRKHGGSKKHDVKDSASASLSSGPALVPRATPATPAKGATTTASGDAPAPTPHPGKGHAAKGSGKNITTTRKGRDGHSTVYHIHRAAKTPCYAQATGAAMSGKGVHGKVDAKATPPSSSSSGTPQTPDPSKTIPKTPAAADAKSPSKTTDHKLAARYEELLE